MVLRGVLRRIARQGDMPIRISRQTWTIILRANGSRWEVQDNHREIDAMALEALVRLAGGRASL
jgi:hypothetical protein